MKKKGIIMSLVACMMFGVVGCTSSSDNEKTQVEQIKEKGVLVIGTSADYPPYEFHKEIDGKDTIVGMDIDVATEIAEELGVELEIKDMKFDGIIASLQAGNIDMAVAGLTPTEERKQAVNFTDVYYNGENIIVTNNKSKDKINSLEDLKNVKVAVQKASLQESIAKELGITDIKSLGKIQELILELNNENVDAIIVSKEAMPGYFKEFTSLVESNVKLENNEEGSAIGVKKSEDTSLVEISNKVINELKEEGKIEEFMQNATELSQ